MFKKKIKPPAADIYHKVVKTWYGGTKIVPTTKSEQKKLKAALDKKNDKLSWIDVGGSYMAHGNCIFCYRQSVYSGFIRI